MALAPPQFVIMTLRQSENLGGGGRARIPFVLTLAGAAATGITFSGSEFQVVNNGGSFSDAAGTVSEIGGGLYHYTATTGELGSVGYFTLKLAKTGIDTLFVTCEVRAWNFNDVTNSRPDVNIGATSANVITSTSIADGAIAAGKIGSLAITDDVMGRPTAAVSGTGTATTFGTTLTQTTNDYWKDIWVVIRSGALVGQCHQILSYNGTTKEITLVHPFTAAPANAVQFALINI